MLESFVIHLRPVGLATGALVGEVEHVASGRRSPVRDVHDLLAFLASCVSDESQEPS